MSDTENQRNFISKLVIFKILEMLLVCSCIALQVHTPTTNTKGANSIDTLSIIAFGGYVIILFGLILSHICLKPVDAKIDIYFSIVAAVLLLVAGSWNLYHFIGSFFDSFDGDNNFWRDDPIDGNNTSWGDNERRAGRHYPYGTVVKHGFQFNERVGGITKASISLFVGIVFMADFAAVFYTNYSCSH